NETAVPRSAIAMGRVSQGVALQSPASQPLPNPTPRGRSMGAGGGGYARAGSGSLGGSISATDAQRKDSNSRVHPAIAAVIGRLAKKETTVSALEAGFVKAGKVEIQIWLSEKTPAGIAELKRLGLEVLVDTPGSKLVIGRLPIEKLAALAELKFVRFVAPQS
ncbi:MAG: hypothetical protein ABI882_20765, partial [Acidobacteriota bacterium]